MITILKSFLCECGKCSPVEEIPYSDELQADFQEYVEQRDKYCLISPACFRKLQISENRVAVKENDYVIIEDGDE